MFFCNINHCNDSAPCWDIDWTIQSYLILSYLILSYLEDAVQDQDDEFQEIEDSSDVIDEPSKMFCYRLIPFH